MSDNISRIKYFNIKNMTSPNVLRHAQAIFEKRAVEIVHLDQSAAQLRIRTSQGITLYIDIGIKSGALNAKCSCPRGSWDICEHQAASILHLTAHFDGKVPGVKQQPAWQKSIRKSLDVKHIDDVSTSFNQTPYWLFFALSYSRTSTDIVPYTILKTRLPFGYASERTSTADSIAFIAENKELLEDAQPVSRQLLVNKCLNANKELVTVANLLWRYRSATRYSHSGRESSLSDYLELLATHNAPMVLAPYKRYEPTLSDVAYFISEPSTLQLKLQEGADGLTLKPQIENQGDVISDFTDDAITVLLEDPVWLLAGNNITRVEQHIGPSFLASLKNLAGVTVPKDSEEVFLRSYLPQFIDSLDIVGDRIQRTKVEDADPKPQLRLAEENGDLSITLHFDYEGHTVPFSKSAEQHVVEIDPGDTWHLVSITRNLDLEADWQAVATTAKTGLKRPTKGMADNAFLLRSNVTPVDFLLYKTPKLIEAGYAIFGEETLKSVKVNRSTPSMSLNVSSGIDWFDIVPLIAFGDATVALKDIRKAFKEKQRFVKLSDGSIGELPAEWLDKYKYLFGLGEEGEDTIRLQNHHLTLIDQMLEHVDALEVDQAYKERLARLQNFAGIAEQPLPAGFVGDLRPYQKSGYDWLHFLHDFGFGGCLADDMGLGKTVQVLTFLQSLREAKQIERADLIVVPKSLLINWEREAQKFTPNLKLNVYFGPSRDKDLTKFDQYDVIVTTYGTMRSDISLFADYVFNYVVLDESQAIKTPTSQVSKAARLMRSHHRLVMTGTPVENSTFELWSQFAFLNPGLLGSVQYFKSEFASPIERDRNDDAAETLRRMVFPFILRRTKDQVAKDLPPRTERILYVDMEPQQRQYYDTLRNNYRSELLNVIQTEGMNKARFKILEGLLRLRQSCNHPKLVTNGYQGDSGKLLSVINTMETLREEGHKALVFSQFVGTLALLEAELQKRNIRYSYLDGQTTKRQDVVDEFQTNDDIGFFLISLKAGGVGLNLTAADYVLHVDPWWNPAAEQQATDRTHRIGQDKPVFVYKFITKDSVEEKILELQESKRALVEQLVTADQNFFKTLTPEDVQVLFQ